MQPYIIGIDIGTGSTKGVAVTSGGHVLDSAQVHYGMTNTTPPFSEQDPQTIWAAFIETISTLAARLPEPPAAVSLSSCMHSLILLDAQDNPVTPNITWADRRSAAIAEALRAAPEGESIYKTTGTPIHAMSPLCKLRWFSEAGHGHLKKFAKAVSIKEYIWHKVFGVWEVDHSIASATGLFDIVACDWAPQALAFCGVSPQQLSLPLSTHFIRTGLLAEAALALHLPQDTPFCIGASDGCLANVGSNAMEKGTAAVTIGTSGAVRLASPQPIPVFPQMLFNYRLDDETFICGGAVNNGGNVVQWLLRNFLKTPCPEGEGYAELFKMAAAVPPGSDGLLCLPYLNGERTPLWDEAGCGVFFGMRPHHGNAHFVRAALEGGCFALHDVLKNLEVAAGPVHTLQVSGGIVHAPVWMQLLADVTGKTLHLQQTEDASALGAALLGFKALGLTTVYRMAHTEAQQTIQPHAAVHEGYERVFPLFRELYATLRPAMRRLYDLHQP